MASVLRGLKVAIIHVEDRERDLLANQLHRIGCHVSIIWPMPEEAPRGMEMVIMHLDHRFQPAKSWSVEENAPALVALLEYEDPVTVKALLDAGVHGVLVKPLRPAGILSTLSLACWLRGYHQRLEAKVHKLETTIKAQRDISKAARILAALQNMPESDAFESIRSQATRRRIPMADVAASIIGAQDVLKDLSKRA